MKYVVTGAAGFVGSHLAERLALAEGTEMVYAIDCFTDYYDPAIKRANAQRLKVFKNVTFVEDDLSHGIAAPMLSACRAVFHLAGQPGVRASWDDCFDEYTSRNVNATRSVLSSVTAASPSPRLVFASSSSVYGNRLVEGPSRETDLPRPFSPYGVTKLASEHLVQAYVSNRGLDAAILRLFTVYGPRQRPDMAMHRLVKAALSGSTFPIFGDGEQAREFTFVTDVVDAFLLAAATTKCDAVPINIASGMSASLREVVQMTSQLAGCEVPIEWLPSQEGDVRITAADTSRARECLGWMARTDLATGLKQQIDAAKRGG